MLLADDCRTRPDKHVVVVGIPRASRPIALTRLRSRGSRNQQDRCKAKNRHRLSHDSRTQDHRESFTAPRQLGRGGLLVSSGQGRIFRQIARQLRVCSISGINELRRAAELELDFAHFEHNMRITLAVEKSGVESGTPHAANLLHGTL